ncbi:MAG: FKBP-type peptidyl-prolyl cis-trans isomerase [Candidatus Azobacteroides sp.]|nr:FKBP-type peptidyl-prolyl cis-trans isomerase [Candidatus Azobacteroides sp.]
MKISDDKVVLLTYDLSVGEEEERELMESATRENPLKFMYGMGMMLDAFEQNIDGLQIGDTFSFSLSPDEAYGDYFEEKVVDLPKHLFEIDGIFDEKRIAEGETLPMMDSNGNRLMGSILEVKPDVVVMDFNHPLAGETLHFEGEIIDVHEASEEEIEAFTYTYNEQFGSEGDCSQCGHSDENGCGGRCN